MSQKKNILVIGGGGREFAITQKLSTSQQVAQIYCSPGNAGTLAFAKNVDLVLDLEAKAVGDFCRMHHIDLVVVGPENPLAEGIADALSAQGIRVFGTSKRATQLESSKLYAKSFMKKYGIPHAEQVLFQDKSEAIHYVKTSSYPCVLKVDGLAAGKGVVVAHNEVEALRGLDDLYKLTDRVFAEKYILGKETSFLCLVDHHSYRIFDPAKDYKRIFDGDQGENTGGMGNYSPDHSVPEHMIAEFETKVMVPFMKGIQAEGIDFRGVLFVGLMYDEEGLYVLEFNTRFGDPETEVTLPRLENDLLTVLEAVVDNRLSDVTLAVSDMHYMIVVLAAEGYPKGYRKGDIITISEALAKDDDVSLVHFGTAYDAKENLVTNGGRVIGVLAKGDSKIQAQKNAYRGVGYISFRGMHFRTDIGI